MTKKTTNKKRTKVGRPKKSVKERVEAIKFDYGKIEKIAMYGLTDAQLADLLDVDIRTIHRWKKDEQFVSHLKKGKLVADIKVMDSFYKRALGFEYTEVKKEGTDAGTVEMISKVTKTTKYFPPDTGACIFWLKNRLGWVDKQEFTGYDDVVIEVNLVD